MGTNATIIANIDNIFYSIYVNYDGDTLLPILQKHYVEEHDIKALIELGNLSELHTSTDCPKGHNFNNRIDGYCVAYGRDRGEFNTAAHVYEGLQLALEKEHDHYTYIYSNGKWSKA